jgi:hypothetical protein
MSGNSRKGGLGARPLLLAVGGVLLIGAAVALFTWDRQRSGGAKVANRAVSSKATTTVTEKKEPRSTAGRLVARAQGVADQASRTAAAKNELARNPQAPLASAGTTAPKGTAPSAPGKGAGVAAPGTTQPVAGAAPAGKAPAAPGSKLAPSPAANPAATASRAAAPGTAPTGQTSVTAAKPAAPSAGTPAPSATVAKPGTPSAGTPAPSATAAKPGAPSAGTPAPSATAAKPGAPNPPTAAAAAGGTVAATGIPHLDRTYAYQYNALGRRDPFQSLISGDFVGVDVGGNAPPDMGSLKIVGVVWGDTDRFALAEDARGNSYVLREGDKLMNGFVETVRRDAVVVQSVVDDETQSVTLPLQRKGETNAKR